MLWEEKKFWLKISKPSESGGDDDKKENLERI
jgi:hypothetical protein